LPQVEGTIDEANKDLEELQKYIGELNIFLPLAFCTVNPLNRILGVSKAFCGLTGYSELETTGNNIDMFFLEKKEIKEFEAEIINRKEKIEREFTLILKNQTNIPVNVTALARREETGEFVGYFLTITDISRTKQFQQELERQVEEKTKELREKIEELEKFNRIVVGRELKMVALKEKIKKLEEKPDKNDQSQLEEETG